MKDYPKPPYPPLEEPLSDAQIEHIEETYGGSATFWGGLVTDVTLNAILADLIGEIRRERLAKEGRRDG